MVDIKFCGLTRSEDVAQAERLNAAYVGVIFAGGPRHLSEQAARNVLRNGGGARRVGVFPSAHVPGLTQTVQTLALDVVQVHADADPGELEQLRAETGVDVWAVLRISGSDLPGNAAKMFAVADAVVLDTRVEGTLGGSGTKFDWANVATKLQGIRGTTPVVLAGGLNPDNVVDAIAAITPDVVDVSSGVESAPGIKNHDLMSAFVFSVRSAATLSG